MLRDITSVHAYLQAEWADGGQPPPSLPHALVPVSALSGSGIEGLRQALQELLLAADGHAAL